MQSRKRLHRLRGVGIQFNCEVCAPLANSRSNCGGSMSLRLYTSWFSPFARKVALALELKGLQYEAIDALRRDFHSTLVTINPRAEVPALVDGDITVVNSSDILLYLEMAYPSPAIYPLSVKDRVTARALERLHDHRFDPIIVDSSYWVWAERPDQPPPGLKDAAQKDMNNAL